MIDDLGEFFDSFPFVLEPRLGLWRYIRQHGRLIHAFMLDQFVLEKSGLRLLLFGARLGYLLDGGAPRHHRSDQIGPVFV